MTDALTCAAKILSLVKAVDGLDCNNLRLQKLVYYSQAWHLALHEAPLFLDPIEAWIHGPVVRNVFATYKYSKLKPIACDPQLDSHLMEVFDVYGAFTGYELERMTHRERPWIDARAGLAPDAPSTRQISFQAMQDYYGSLV